jgi:transposase
MAVSGMHRKTLSLDLRERILKAYDQGEGTQIEVAHRFDVSHGMVKKLIQQRRHVGTIAPLHHRAGRKPQIESAHRWELRALVTKKPDTTLEEMRVALGLKCTIQAIHYVLLDMGLTYKKRRSGPANKTGHKSLAPGGSGSAVKAASIRPSSSSSTSRARKPI